jgi:hypothetical protein
MKKNILYKVLGLALLTVGMIACDTASQDASPVVSPDGYPVATFTLSSTSTTINEGDTLTYTITTNKAIERAITFTPVITLGTATADDFTVEPVVLQPYSTEAEMYIIANSDDLPEATNETFKVEITVAGIAERYLLKPGQVFPSVNLSIANVNDETLLTLSFAWDTEDDIDMVTWRDRTATSQPLQAWGNGGATSANPETDKSIWVSDPDGTYYVNLMDYGADPFNYTFLIGHPNGTVQTITGTFDRSATTYTMDPWTAGWTGNSYRVLQVVHTGETFVVTKL